MKEKNNKIREQYNKDPKFYNFCFISVIMCSIPAIAGLLIMEHYQDILIIGIGLGICIIGLFGVLLFIGCILEELLND